MKIERINDWFARQGRWMVQKRWLVLSLFILVFAIGFTGLRYFKVSASWENYSRRRPDACQDQRIQGYIRQ